jgi:peroxiredoxin
MNKNIIISLSCLLILMTSIVVISFQKETISNLDMVTIEGEKITSKDLLGKVVLINFWATDCSGCIAEMPDLIKTFNMYKNKNFELIAVSMFYDPPNRVVSFSKKNNLPFPVVLDLEKKIMAQFNGVTLTPTSFLIDHEGKIINKALPSMPVEILGMNDTAFAGAEFLVTENENKSKEIVEFRKSGSSKINGLVAKDKTTLFENKNNKEELNIILKSDVQGSSEALKMAINKIEHDEVKANIILSDIGMINESDVSLAKASHAILIGFNVKPNREAKKLAEEQSVDIKYYNIIKHQIQNKQ